MIEQELTHLIALHPDRGELPVACVKAVCFVESAFDEWAYRYEPTYRYLVGDQTTLTVTERMGQMTSWGICQVMGGVAREAGLTGSLASLCQPTIGLRYGMRHLRKFYTRYQSWSDAFASYNAGQPKKGLDGKYFNQSYVDKVLRYWAQFEKELHVVPKQEV